MDIAEAFGPYRRVRELVLFMLLSTGAVSFGLMSILRRRERLLATNAAYGQAVPARDDMMAMVSHDLKNPINTIILRCHIMMEMLQDGKSESVLHNL